MTVERALPNLDRLPRPVYGRSESLPAGSVARSHSHPWAQLSWASSGVLVVRTAEASHVATPQRAVWVPPGMPHEVVTSNRAEMRSLYIDAAAAAFAPPRCRVLAVTPLARELIQAASALPPDYAEDGPDGRLAAVLLDQLALLPETGLTLPWPTDPRLVAICEALRATPHDNRNMAAWASRAGMTERTLGRLFPAETGLTFGKWRQRTRLLASLSALESGKSVTRTAIECGYDSVSAFISAFKQAFGKTPGEFLRG